MPILDPVMMELRVSASREQARTWLSLGRQYVAWPAGEHVLHFQIPPMPATTDFDELTIRFEMEPRRNTESAKVGVRYLMLIPK